MSQNDLQINMNAVGSSDDEAFDAFITEFLPAQWRSFIFSEQTVIRSMLECIYEYEAVEFRQFVEKLLKGAGLVDFHCVINMSKVEWIFFKPEDSTIRQRRMEYIYDEVQKPKDGLVECPGDANGNTFLAKL